MFQSILELPIVVASVGPCIQSTSVWLPVEVHAIVGISVCEEVGAPSVLHALFPVALVPIAVCPSVDTLAFSLAIFPLTHVGVVASGHRVLLVTLPNSVAMPHAPPPLSIVYLVRGSPQILALSMSFTVSELTLVDVPVGVPFVAAPMTLVTYPVSLIDPLGLVLHYAFALPYELGLLGFYALTEIDRVGILLDVKVRRGS